MKLYTPPKPCLIITADNGQYVEEFCGWKSSVNIN
jgi:hypothetical protein